MSELDFCVMLLDSSQVRAGMWWQHPLRLQETCLLLKASSPARCHTNTSIKAIVVAYFSRVLWLFSNVSNVSV